MPTFTKLGHCVYVLCSEADGKKALGLMLRESLADLREYSP